MWSRLKVFGAAVAAMSGVLVAASPASPSGGGADWPGYLRGPEHVSFSARATRITVANAATIVRHWVWTPPKSVRPGQPPAYLTASPTVYGGSIFIGTKGGDFYALDAHTGKVTWHQFLGDDPHVKGSNCDRGIDNTAAVSPDPNTGSPTVYVYGGDGNLDALDAANGTLRWQTPVAPPKQESVDYHEWSSPTVLNGLVYVGLSSDCEVPAVQGGVAAFDQATGTRLALYRTVPHGVGGSVWSSVAARGSSVWVTTGNAAAGQPNGDSDSLVRLDSATLARQDGWTIPGLRGTDLDFGASPTLFTAVLRGSPTDMVGGCDKNGIFYALKAGSLSVGPVWTRRLGIANTGSLDMCIAAAVWEGGSGRLFVASNTTAISGTKYPSSLRQLDPATGAPVWERGLPAGPILGTPALDGSGVLVATTYGSNSQNFAFFVDAANGKLLRSIPLVAPSYSQPVFAAGALLLASVAGRLESWGP